MHSVTPAISASCATNSRNRASNEVRCARGPRIQKLLSEARAKGVYVIYALFPSPSPATFPAPKISDYVPELAPQGNEPVVTAFVDKFIRGDKDTGSSKDAEGQGDQNPYSGWRCVAQRRFVHFSLGCVARVYPYRTSVVHLGSHFETKRNVAGAPRVLSTQICCYNTEQWLGARKPSGRP
jgi:hypothetical protein